MGKRWKKRLIQQRQQEKSATPEPVVEEIVIPAPVVVPEPVVEEQAPEPKPRRRTRRKRTVSEE